MNGIAKVDYQESSEALYDRSTIEPRYAEEVVLVAVMQQMWIWLGKPPSRVTRGAGTARWINGCP